MTNPTFPKRIRTAPWIKQYEPKAGDGLCPGFWSGCPAVFGCPYRCDYCFLARYRFMPDKKLKDGEGKGCVLYPLTDATDVARENRRRLQRESDKWYNGDVPPEEMGAPAFINWGETADSLACESHTGFLSHIMDWAQDPDYDLPVHLLLTKSAGDGWLDWILDQEPTDKLIFAFSVTTAKVADLYEHGSPPLLDRLRAATHLVRAGWRVRLRIDPLAPVSLDNAAAIRQLISATLYGDRQFRQRPIQEIADGWGKPELITLGTLRFNTHHKLVKQFGMTRMPEDPRWRLPIEQRVELCKAAVEAIDGRVPVALCKETPECWQEVFGHVPEASEIRCNCTG